MRLILASSNAGKLAELRRLLADLPCEVVEASAIGVTLPPETGDTYVANAQLKARAAAEQGNAPALGDDTGLEVDVLDGHPGLGSARFADEAGGWAQANRALAHQVGLVDDPSAVVTGTLRCALALADGSQMHTAEGSCPVVLRWPPHGDGPGFEPILAPADPSAPIVVDGVFTHRRRAFERLRPALARACAR